MINDRLIELKAILDTRAELRIYRQRGDKQSELDAFKRLINLYATLNITDIVTELEALENRKAA